MKNIKLPIAALLVTTFFASTVHAVNVLPVNSKPFGQSYANWAADFTRWLYSIPADRNPYITGNLNCTQPQYGPVWFVTTNTNTSKDPYMNSVVQCDVPEGKAIFLHVGAYFDTWPCPDPNFKPSLGQSLEDFLTLDAQASLNFFTPKPNGLNIDGRPVLSIDKGVNQRVSTKLFTLTGDPSLNPSLDSCITGKPQQAVSDGYWAMIVGLRPGLHTFTFSEGSTMKVNIVNSGHDGHEGSERWH